MLSSKMKINKELLPMKGHFFFFNAGTAPLVPYMSTYARQLGFTSSTVGLIYTVLPITGLIAKPLFGGIADRFKMQKSLFIFFQLVTAITFLGIYFIPESQTLTTVELDCGDGTTFLRSCYGDESLIDTCKVKKFNNDSSTVSCNMNCDMSSSTMWQTVCEHWNMPQYCYSNVKNISFTSYINDTKMINNSCTNLYLHKVILDGYSYTPYCHVIDGHLNTNESCKLHCNNSKIASLIHDKKVNMSCVKNDTHYTYCDSNFGELSALIRNLDSNNTIMCDTVCELDTSQPWRLMEICEGWKADVTKSCRPRTIAGTVFPTTLSFIGILKLHTIITEKDCVFIELKEIHVADGSVHYPVCVSRAQYESVMNLFHTECKIQCNNSEVNELFQSAWESKNQNETQLSGYASQFTYQFWLFFILMIASWIGQAVVVSIADAICFNMLGDKPSKYGRQRLWGSVGWGAFSLLTGTLIDRFSDGAVKDYTVAFILMFVFLSIDVLVSCLIKNRPTKMSFNILSDVGSLLYSFHTIMFLLWTVGVGLCTGLLWQFLFWHLEDIAGETCDGATYVKTLQGLVSAIQSFGGEMPFMFLSGPILKKVGHVNMMSIVLLAFGCRFILYSFLTNAWWVLPIEMLQGVTFGMFYPTMTSYASVVSPPGTETTVQGFVGAIFEGVGVSLGSLIGGRLYDVYGGWQTFRWYGIGSLIFCLIHVVVHILLGRPTNTDTPQQGNDSSDDNDEFSSIIRYQKPNDAIQMLDDNSDWLSE